MKIKYRAMKGGIGVFLDVNIEASIQHRDNSFSNIDVQILFDGSIPLAYKEGIPYMEKTIEHYFPLIANGLKDKILRLNVVDIESNPAHYQVESFIGVTVGWIREYFQVEVSDPSYYFDSSARKFIFTLT